MRDHIRREAWKYDDAAWWIVPVAFAAAAMAALVFGDTDTPESQGIAALYAQPVTQDVQPVSAPAPAKPQTAEEPAYEPEEHVQAF